MRHLLFCCPLRPLRSVGYLLCCNMYASKKRESYINGPTSIWKKIPCPWIGTHPSPPIHRRIPWKTPFRFGSGILPVSWLSWRPIKHKVPFLPVMDNSNSNRKHKNWRMYVFVRWQMSRPRHILSICWKPNIKRMSRPPTNASVVGRCWKAHRIRPRSYRLLIQRHRSLLHPL
jgi:hypothetical protein